MNKVFIYFDSCSTNYREQTSIQLYRSFMLAFHVSTNLKPFRFAIPAYLRINKSSRLWFADASLITHRKHISQTQRFNITSFIFSTTSVGSIFVFTSGISTWAVSPHFPIIHRLISIKTPICWLSRPGSFHGPGALDEMRPCPLGSKRRRGSLHSTRVVLRAKHIG